MSDTDLLREAATLIRERAKAATPGPWYVPARGSGIEAGEYDTVIGPGPVDCMAHCYGGISTIDGDRLGADQEHIAAWHPGVAPAVADWLDKMACVAMGSVEDPVWAEAKAVARVFLGRPS